MEDMKTIKLTLAALFTLALVSLTGCSSWDHNMEVRNARDISYLDEAGSILAMNHGYEVVLCPKDVENSKLAEECFWHRIDRTQERFEIGDTVRYEDGQILHPQR
jgi:hypothetical protein